MSFLSLAVATTLTVLLVLGECKSIQGRGIISDSHEAARTKRSPQQLKLCGNQLINMLGIICRIYHSNKGEGLRRREEALSFIF